MKNKLKHTFFSCNIMASKLLLRAFIFTSVAAIYGFSPSTYSNPLETLKLIVQQQISGTVTDESGLPIPGVSIVIKGTTTGTQTDFDGNYSLATSSENPTLVFSYIGYKTKEIASNGLSKINVKLDEDVSQLDEVVVVGFGTQNSKNVSASIAQVSAKELGVDSRPVTNLASALVGSMPGLNSFNTNGQPGSTPDFSIRGASSLNNTSVLVIIDDFEGSLDDINPQEIESATILKDAAAVAIYGARGANGVLLITTKKTKKGEKISVTYNMSHSLQAKGNLPDLSTATEYINFVNTAAPGTFNDTVISLAESGFYPDTNWADALYNNTASQQTHNLSLRGGTENVSFLMSAGYLTQEGLAKGTDDFNRMNLRLKIDANVTDWLQVGTNTLITNRVTNTVPVTTGTNLLGSPFMPVTSVDGYYVDKSGGLYGGIANPIALSESGSYSKTERDNINLQLYAKLTPLKGLSIEQRVSFLKNNTTNRDWDNVYDYVTLDYEDPDSYTNPESVNRSYTFGESAARTMSLYSTTSHTITALTRINYDFNINNVHNFKALVGFQSQQYEGEGFAAARQGFSLDSPNDLILGEEAAIVSLFGAGQQALGSTSYLENTATVSYFGRLNYDYKGRYIIEGTFRYDGSSYFAKNNRYGFFPSAAIAWNVKEEPFMKDVNWLDRLKFRGSYGITGDDSGVGALTVQLVDYDASGGYPIGGNTSPSYTLSTFANPDLKWETAKIFNVGVDLSLWQGKLQLNTDYFINNRVDILDFAEVPDEFGFGDVPANLYDVKSWGWEIDVTHKNQIGDDFSYWINGNLSSYDNEITDLAGFESDNFAVGQSVKDRFGYVTDSFFDSQEEIDTYTHTDDTLIDQSSVGGSYIGGFKYVDQLTIDTDGDGVMDEADGAITADDRIILDANSATNLRFGFNLGFNYKELSVSARFYGAFDRDQWWNGANAHEPFIGSNNFSYQQNYWSADNTDAFFPTPVNFGTQSYTSAVSHFIRDNEFVKMQNLTVGYDLTKNFKHLKAIKLNLSFENLGVIWTNSPVYEHGWDPEIGTGTVNYPLPFTTSIGLNVTF